MNGQFWWHLTRASGLVSWALAGISVLLGLALATRALGGRPKAPWLLDLHRFASALSVGFAGVHVGALVADSYVHFGFADVVVPFASGYERIGTAMGVIAAWLLVAVEATSLLKRRLPTKVWHAVHLASYGLFTTATAHLFMVGTDAQSLGAIGAAVVLCGAVTFFLVYRVIGPGRAASVRPAGGRTPRAPAAATARIPRRVG